jgi:hypothetical protein
LIEAAKQALGAHLQDEARAYLEGWNDAIDAATAEAFQLLKTSRNMHILLEAAMLQPSDRLTPIGTLQFPPDDHNRGAVVSVLMHSPVPDFQ